MPRISQLPSLVAADGNDEIAIVDSSAATTKKITREDFLKGSDLPDDTVTTDAIDDGAVTPDKRSGGYKVGEFIISSTGNISVTGVGFKPKLVRVRYSGTSNSRVDISEGAMDEAGNQHYVAYYTSSAGSYSRTGTDAVLTYHSLPGGTFTEQLRASYVSMDSSGFTLNVTLKAVAGNIEFHYEAYA